MDTPATLASGTVTRFNRRWTSVTNSILGESNQLLQNSTLQHMCAMSATSGFARAFNAAQASRWSLPEVNHSSG